MTKQLIKIDGLYVFDSLIFADIMEGELAAVIGPNKSGKTTLARILRDEIRHDPESVSHFIEPRQIAYSAHSADNTFFHYSDFYYQQRYNPFDVADVDTVAQYLQYDPACDYMEKLYKTILPQTLLLTKIIELSSGETRKVLLLKSLFKKAKVHILDNPMSGMDEASACLTVNGVQGNPSGRSKRRSVLSLPKFSCTLRVPIVCRISFFQDSPTPWS